MTDQQISPKPRQAFDDLVEAMPRIAAVVTQFPESVQGKVFDALMDAYSGASTTASTNGKTDATMAKAKRPSRKKKTSDNGGTTKRRGGGGPTMLKDLDLAPKGKTSFKDFVAEKAPQSQHDQNVASVYYLTQKAGLSPITIDHVVTCYRVAGWKVPPALANSLRLTASKKGYIDTANSQNILLANHGINRVEHDLPVKSKE